MKAILVVLAILLAYRFGFDRAHAVVAKECDTLGAFYVGNTVYVCVRKEQRAPLESPTNNNQNLEESLRESSN